MRVQIAFVGVTEGNPNILSDVFASEVYPPLELNLDLLPAHHMARDEVGPFPIIWDTVGVISVGGERAGNPLEIEYLLLARI